MHFSILEESKQKNKNGEREPKKNMQNWKKYGPFSNKIGLVGQKNEAKMVAIK